MTDLLTPSDAGSAEVDDRRTFRAATLDEAVAAARDELGPDVELVEAHRVRRGGLGGFFATDLGVEIVAVPRRSSTGSQAFDGMLAADGAAPGFDDEIIEDMIDDERDRAAAAAEVAALLAEASAPMPSIDGSLPVSAPPADVQTALDRLIEHAESVDRVIPRSHADLDLAPIADPRDDAVDVPVSTAAVDPDEGRHATWQDDGHLSPETRLDSFEEYLRAELAAPTPVPTGELPPSIADSIDAGDEFASSPDPDGSNRSFVGGVGLADAVPTLDGLVDLGTPGTFVGPSIVAPISTPETRAPCDDIQVDDVWEAPSDVATSPTDPMPGHVEPAERSVDGVTGDELVGAAPVDDAEPVTVGADAAGVDLDAATDDVDDAVHTELAPPSPRLNPSLRDADDPLDELDELLRDLGIDVEPIAAAVAQRQDAAGSVRMVALAATEQLVEGAAALAQCSGRSVRRLAVTITAPDGTVVEMSAELAPGSTGEPPAPDTSMSSEAPVAAETAADAGDDSSDVEVVDG